MREALTLHANHALLTRANPLAKFGVVMLMTVVLALSIDWVSASVALAFELALLPLAGLTLGLLWQRGWPLILAAAVAAAGGCDQSPANPIVPGGDGGELKADITASATSGRAPIDITFTSNVRGGDEQYGPCVQDRHERRGNGHACEQERRGDQRRRSE